MRRISGKGNENQAILYFYENPEKSVLNKTYVAIGNPASQRKMTTCFIRLYTLFLVDRLHKRREGHKKTKEKQEYVPLNGDARIRTSLYSTRY
jgi:hypothetical protein